MIAQLVIAVVLELIAQVVPLNANLVVEILFLSLPQTTALLALFLK